MVKERYRGYNKNWRKKEKKVNHLLGMEYSERSKTVSRSGRVTERDKHWKL